MREALLLLVAVMALAGTATAHYAAEVDTPAGTVCVLNQHVLLHAVEDGDAAAAATAVVAVGCA